MARSIQRDHFADTRSVYIFCRLASSYMFNHSSQSKNIHASRMSARVVFRQSQLWWFLTLLFRPL